MGLTPCGNRAFAAQPLYQGEKFSRVLELRSWEVTASAALELGLDQTLPILIRGLEEDDTLLGEAKQAVWNKLPRSVQQQHLQQMPVPASSTRFKALMTLGEIGLEARGAVPAVIRQLSRCTNAADRGGFLQVLARIGEDSPEAVAELTKALQSPQSATRENAALALGFIGPKAASAAPVLLKQLRTSDHPPATFLATLGRMGPGASNAVPTLMKLLLNASNTVSRIQALQALRRLGPSVAPALPELLKVIERREPGYPLAVEALLNSGPPARESLPQLEALLTDSNAVARVLAAAAVIKAGGAEAKALEVLTQVLENPKGSPGTWSPPFTYATGLSVAFNASLTAAWLLADCGPSAHTALPALARAMQPQRTWMAVVAARACWKIEGNPEPVLPVLMEALQHLGDSEIEPALAAMVLAEMGPKAQTAVPTLEAARVHGKRNLRREATLALARIRESAATDLRSRSTQPSGITETP